MPPLSTQLLMRRADLVIRPFAEAGRYVVKIAGTQDYFHLGEEEHFLLLHLDGEKDAGAVCRAFESRFGDSLTEEDLDGFIEMARGQGLVAEAESGGANGVSPLSADNANGKGCTRLCERRSWMARIAAGRRYLRMSNWHGSMGRPCPPSARP